MFDLQPFFISARVTMYCVPQAYRVSIKFNEAVIQNEYKILKIMGY